MLPLNKQQWRQHLGRAQPALGSSKRKLDQRGPLPPPGGQLGVEQFKLRPPPLELEAAAR